MPILSDSVLRSRKLRGVVRIHAGFVHPTELRLRALAGRVLVNPGADSLDLGLHEQILRDDVTVPLILLELRFAERHTTRW